MDLDVMITWGYVKFINGTYSISTFQTSPPFSQQTPLPCYVVLLWYVIPLIGLGLVRFGATSSGNSGWGPGGGGGGGMVAADRFVTVASNYWIGAYLSACI